MAKTSSYSVKKNYPKTPPLAWLKVNFFCPSPLAGVKLHCPRLPFSSLPLPFCSSPPPPHLPVISDQSLSSTPPLSPQYNPPLTTPSGERLQNYASRSAGRYDRACVAGHVILLTLRPGVLCLEASDQPSTSEGWPSEQCEWDLGEEEERRRRRRGRSSPSGE